jgi:ParB-like chromosome segregation protein Spo0J
MATVISHRYATRRALDLVPHPDNPNEGDVDGIGESIEAIGFFGVVLVQASTGRILAGEHRWRAAQAAGLDELPVIEVDCDDDTARKILLADNAFARLAVWNEDALTALLVDMTSGGGDLIATGFTADDLASMLAKQAEGLPPGFEHLTPRDGDEATPRTVTCPNCGHQWSP